MSWIEEALKKAGKSSPDKEAGGTKEKCPLKNKPYILIMVAKAGTMDPLGDAEVEIKGPTKAKKKSAQNSGVALFDPVKPGKYTIQVKPPGSGPASKFTATGSVKTSVAKGGHLVQMMTLNPPASVQVSVLRSDNRKPIGDARVFLRGIKPVETTTAAASGMATLNDLLPGIWSLQVQPPAKEEKMYSACPVINLEIKPGQVVRREVLLAPAGVLKATVRKGTDNQPLPDIKIHAEGQPDRTTAPGSGIATFDPIPAGTYNLTCTLTAAQLKQWEPPAPLSTRIEPGATREVQILLRERALEIVKVDDHFAPSMETADITFRVRGYERETLKLQVFSENYPDRLVFEHELEEKFRKDGTHEFAWNGLANCEDGPLAGRHFIHPLFSPYTVKLVCPGNEVEAEAPKPLLVRYHSLKLQMAEYTPDEQEPDRQDDTVRWVQYKLNKLGYYSGMVDGIAGEQTKRAIRRYTYAHEGYYKNNRQKEIDDYRDAQLQTQLANDEGKIDILSGDKLPDEGAEAKWYLEHNYFYTNAEDVETPAQQRASRRKGKDKENFLDPWGSTKQDKEKLDRLELPIEAVILLVGKADADGSGNGVEAKRAVGPVQVQWSVIDPREKTNQLPDDSNPDVPSRTRAYMDKMLQAIGDPDPGDADLANDNAPAEKNTGVRVTNHPNSAYFRKGKKALPPYECTIEEDLVTVRAHHHPTEHSAKMGRAGVLFRGSYLAGDNYIIEAKLRFEDLPNARDLWKDHLDFTGKSEDDILCTKSGQLTIWRKHTLSAIINWPDGGQAIDWNGEVKPAYEFAFCELDTNLQVYDSDDLFPNPADFVDLVKSTLPANQRNQNIQYYRDGLFPFDFPPQAEYRADGSVSTGWDMNEYFRMVQNRVRTFANGPFKEKLLEKMHRFVRERRRAGSVAFRPNWNRPLTLLHMVDDGAGGLDIHPPGAGQGAINSFVEDPFGIFCMGMAHGFILMSNPMCVNESDQFLYAHELAHCRYLRHQFAGDRNPEDHDRADFNCTMSYPENIPGRSNPDSNDPPPGADPQPPANLLPAANTDLTWNRGDPTQPNFCGKCLLKLRGWDVRDDNLPTDSL